MSIAEQSPTATSKAGTRAAGQWSWGKWRGFTSAALFIGLLSLYLANGEFTPNGDATPNVYTSLSLISQGDFLITPEEAPQLFGFSYLQEGEVQAARVESWNAPSPLGPAWQELKAAGKLNLVKPEYYLVPTLHADQGEYVSAFGPGTAITAAPVYALIMLFSDDIRTNPPLLWYGSKVIASLCVALSALFVFWTVRRLVPYQHAVVIAVCYGAATCVWSVSSQSLWQSGPNILWLSMATYFLFSSKENIRWAAACGFALSMAVLCRSTSALVVMAFGAHFAALSYWRWRTWSASSESSRAWHVAQPVVYFATAGLPLAMLFAWHNYYCFGSPFQTAHLASGTPLAEQTLGSESVWQTPLMFGFMSLLFSYSRGLLVFSPILAIGLWGGVRSWGDDRWRLMRPLSAAVVLILLVTAKHFNWHGGWSFGYRVIVDIVPLLAVCSAVLAVEVWERRPARFLFGAALAWSLLVQVIGAYAYDLDGWNDRKGFLVFDAQEQPVKFTFSAPRAALMAQSIAGEAKLVNLNVDYAVNRGRLWSLADNQLGYYLTHWRKARARKLLLIEARLRVSSTAATATASADSGDS